MLVCGKEKNIKEHINLSMFLYCFPEGSHSQQHLDVQEPEDPTAQASLQGNPNQLWLSQVSDWLSSPAPRAVPLHFPVAQNMHGISAVKLPASHLPKQQCPVAEQTCRPTTLLLTVCKPFLSICCLVGFCSVFLFVCFIFTFSSYIHTNTQ